MYKGTIKFIATMPRVRLQFPSFQFTSTVPGVDAVRIQADGVRISVSVDVSAVSTPGEGITIARDAVEVLLDRLAYSQSVVIAPAELTDKAFTAMNPPPTGTVLAVAAGQLSVRSHAPTAIGTIGLSDATLKAVLEPPSLPGDQNFALLRSARLSVGPVEEFMTLYAILLGLLGDDQKAVDSFIESVEPAVPQTPSPRPGAKPGEMETIYTRLRNELAHRRAGVSLATTKESMSQRVGNLHDIVKEAIRRHP